MDRQTHTIKGIQRSEGFIFYQFTTHFILESQTNVLKGNSTKTLKSDAYQSINLKHPNEVFVIFLFYF